MKHFFRTLSSSVLLLSCNLISLTALGAGASVDEATDAQLKAATDQYTLGVTALEAGKYAEALESFKHSCDEVNSPNARLMLARALLKLGRLPEAYLEFRSTAQHATALAVTQKKYQKTAESAQKELDELKDKLAYVTVRHGVSVQVQGRNVSPALEPEPQPVLPGNVQIDATFADGQKQSKLVTLKPGESFEFKVEPVAAKPIQQAAVAQSRPVVEPDKATAHQSGLNRKTVGYVAGAVGLVGLGAFVGFGLIGASSYANETPKCTPLDCSSHALNNQRMMALFSGIGFTGLGIGLLGVGTSGWLLLSGNHKPAPATALSVSPSEIQLVHRF